MSRRAWLALGIGACAAVAVGGTVYAFGGPTQAQQDAERVLTDVVPLQEQFGEAGRLSDPHWLVYDPDEAERSREFLPSPDARYRVVGVARLPAGTAASIVATPAYAFAPADPVDVPDVLTEFLPAQARWMSSAAFDRRLLAPGTGDVTGGRFFLDPSTDSLYFDAVEQT
ncbi:hypothetical protein [Streptomyces sp. NBC_00887]|uniref:hypothetical protein n=1 Tax=Streptomyces sp. NBC_00887 TaxID=2975859 RepID=UPI0038663044|nr:hypothetical protein OG844_24270 [Streptomyces sp. NBC_00887]